MPTANEPAIRARGTVRISLPAKVAYNPDALKKSLVAVAEGLGCIRCFSGANCLFQSEASFVVDPAGALNRGGAEPAAAASSAEPGDGVGPLFGAV